MAIAKSRTCQKKVGCPLHTYAINPGPRANIQPPGANKRKAEEEPSSPTPSKRIKQDESVEPPEKKPAIKPIPFPEKANITPNCSITS